MTFSFIAIPPNSAFAQAPPSQEVAANRFYFGMMGQIARPGVYELPTSQPQLVDLIQQAGGLTQRATNQLRIVRQGRAGLQTFYSPTLQFPLVPGDVVVADGLINRSVRRQPFNDRNSRDAFDDVRRTDYVRPDLSGAGEDSLRHVALMNLLDRPVILPVPEASASVSSLLSHLGQSQELASRVQVLPVGPARSGMAGDAAALFTVPTVIYFDPRAIQTNRLPEFPPVYRPESQTSLPPVEKPTIPVEPAPTAPPALQAPPVNLDPTPASVPPLTLPAPDPPSEKRIVPPLPNSVVVFPSPPPQTEPPMIAEVRRWEQNLAAQEQARKNSLPSPSPPALTLASSPGEADQNPAPKNRPASDWWPYFGLMLSVLSGVGILVQWRRHVYSQRKTAIRDGHQLPEPLADDPVPNVPPPAGTNDPLLSLLTSEALEALVLNQLPLLEEPAEPTPTEPEPESPKSKHVFRFDPPEELQPAARQRPHFLRRSKPSEPADSEASAGSVPNAEQEPQASSVSLLDRVLRQVHQPPRA